MDGDSMALAGRRKPRILIKGKEKKGKQLMHRRKKMGKIRM